MGDTSSKKRSASEEDPSSGDVSDAASSSDNEHNSKKAQAAPERGRGGKRGRGSGSGRGVRKGGRARNESDGDNATPKPLPQPTPKPKPKPTPKPTPSKSNWSTTEDKMILTLRRQNKSWKEIAAALNTDGGVGGRKPGTVQMRYLRTLQGSNVLEDLTSEQRREMLQAEKDIEGSEKNRFIAQLFKERTQIEVGTSAVPNILRALKNGMSNSSPSKMEEDEEE